MSSSKSKAQDEVQTEPNPKLQADLTDAQADRTEQHIVEKEPTGGDERSAEAPGLRTEPEVVADAKRVDEEQRNAAPHTADPAASTSAVKMPRVEDDERLLHFQRVSDGVVQSVNPGTHEHQSLIRGVAEGTWEQVSRAVARKFHPRTFVSSARRAAQQERAKEQARKALV